MPTEWKEGYLIKLPKKGDLSSGANYRGITLLSITGMVFNRNRMREIHLPRPAGSIPQSEVMDRPDCNTAHHPGAIHEVQLPHLHLAPDLVLKIKIGIFNNMVKPILLYGVETWRTTA